MVKTLSLVVDKEEQLIFDDRSAESSSEHIPTQLVAGRATEIIGPAVRVQFVVANEFPDVPMVAIRTRLGAYADDSALEVSELGGSIIGDQIEFLDGVRSRRVSKQVVRNLVVIHPIEQEIVGLLAIPVN